MLQYVKYIMVEIYILYSICSVSMATTYSESTTCVQSVNSHVILSSQLGDKKPSNHNLNK